MNCTLYTDPLYTVSPVMVLAIGFYLGHCKITMTMMMVTSCGINSLVYYITWTVHRCLGGLLVERRTNVSQILGSTPGQVVTV